MRDMQMKSQLYYVKLSKEISYALRHAPQEYGLTIDKNGWVEIGQLLDALRCDKKWNGLNAEDCENMIRKSDKRRHEIRNGKIRALYGHSLRRKMVKDPLQPPDVLYHGTSMKFLKSIMKTGLIPKRRQYVHLSIDIGTAMQVGRRRDKDCVVLRIDAKKAYNDDIRFYQGSGEVWLADSIKPEYITVQVLPKT